MSGTVELEIPWNKLPEKTPQGQNFTPDQLGVTGTPQVYVDKAGDQAQHGIKTKIAEVMNDETLLCPVDDFLKHYGPVTFKSKDIAREFTKDIAKCKKHLLAKELLRELPDETYGWRDFPVNPAQYAGIREKLVFDKLEPIIKAIDEYASTKGFRARGNNYKYVGVGDTYLHGDIAGTTHKIDGGTIDSEYKDGMLPVRFIMAPHEYKKQRTADDQRTVRQQIVAAAQHIMCDDVRRMFIFGVTIEDTRMSLWYFSRSHSVKALSLDWFHEDIDTFIHVFLKFAYATPEELGIDPTVHLAPRDPKAKLVGATAPVQHYIYEHQVAQDEDPAKRTRREKAPVFKYFKTVQAINDMRPYNISGRNTRIWSVVEVTGPKSNEEVTGERLILKDVWLDTSRNTEAENMDLIFEAIDKLVTKSKAKWTEGDWQARLMAEDPRFSALDDETKLRLQHFLTDGNYKSLFLTKLYAWKGATSKELCAQALHSPEGVDIFPDAGVKLQPGKGERTGTQAGPPVHTGNTSNAPPKGNETEEEVNNRKKQAFERKTRRNFLPKQQSRFVYKEVCKDLDTLGTLGNAMDVIAQALDALRILFCANWVHRDISANNILAFNDNGVWKVKLADLEFSEELGSNVKRTDWRTGTPYYMPYEIMAGTYLLNTARLRRLRPEQSMTVLLKVDEGTPEYERFKIFQLFPTNAKGVPPTATPDIPLPDTIVQYNYQHDLESIWWIVLRFITALVDHQDSKTFSDTIFKSKMTLDQDRGNAFTMDFENLVLKKLHPTLADAFDDFMETLRSEMIMEYKTRELFGQLSVDGSYGYIHALFAKKFRELLQKNVGNWKAMAIAPKGVFIHGSKRVHEEDPGQLEGARTATEPNKRPRTRADRK